MKHGTPFRAALAMAAALAGIQSMYSRDMAAQQLAIQGLGAYEGRGKGRIARHNRGGTARFQRAAVKARNVKRHRAHCKG